MSSRPAAADRSRRQATILDLVRRGAVRTQEEIVAALAGESLDATQATVSRDLRELGLVRIAGEGGTRYVAPDALEPDAATRLVARLERVAREHVLSVEAVPPLLVVRTRASTAPLVGAALDQARLVEVAGCVAGDDTVLVTCRGRTGAATLRARIEAVLRGHAAARPRTTSRGDR